MVKVNWTKFVWIKDALPKHCFIGWLVMHGRLLTRDRLKRMGITMDDTCILCDSAPESHAHLFFACIFSQKCLQLLSQTLGCHLPTVGWTAWWLSQSFRSQVQKRSVAAHLLSLIHAIWWCRNRCRLEGYLPRPETVLAHVVHGIKL
ncbi:uncharacterized protein LOC141595545 [Silene latifolia]|uniref:uncharacterized protein LOC141595545 n=1 Tax=Silene latifolia TaxID=37657 RepID=UPI003D76CA60